MRSRARLIVIVAIILVAGLYVLLRGTGGPSRAYQPQSRAYHLVIADQRLTAGPTVFYATQGDAITLTVRVDKPATGHPHGYEKLVPVEPGHDAMLPFTVARSRSFALGLPNHHCS